MSDVKNRIIPMPIEEEVKDAGLELVLEAGERHGPLPPRTVESNTERGGRTDCPHADCLDRFPGRWAEKGSPGARTPIESSDQRGVVPVERLQEPVASLPGIVATLQVR